jgi:hypothetical protein
MAMSKSTRSLVTTLVLTAVAGIALYVGVFQTHKDEEKKEKEQASAAKAFDFSKADVKGVTLVAKGATTVMEKEGEGWMITSPVATRAEKSSVDAIIDKLADLKAKNLRASVKEAPPEYLVAEGADTLKKYGLDNPRFVVKLSLTDGKELKLAVGEESHFDQSLYYTRGEDNRVYLAESGLRYALDKGLFDLRDKAVVTHEDKDVQSFTVSGNGAAWTVERDADGWKLTSPMADRADKTAIESVLSKIRNARAKAFPLDDPQSDAAMLAKLGFDKPAVEVVFAIGADKAKKTLQITSVDDGGVKKAYARLAEGGPVAEVDTTLSTDLVKPVADLRDKTVAPFEREKLAKLQIIPADGAPVVLTRTKTRPPDGGAESDEIALEGRSEKLKTWKATSAFYTLSNLRGVTIADETASDLAKYGLDKPKVTFVVTDAGGQELSRILIGNETGTRYYAVKAGSNRVLEVEKSTVDDIPRKAEDIIDTPPPAANKQDEKKEAASGN